ncbi:hypothetical protein J6590_069287, partial [Homalodisca vitripennis]
MDGHLGSLESHLAPLESTLLGNRSLSLPFLFPLSYSLTTPLSLYSSPPSSPSPNCPSPPSPLSPLFLSPSLPSPHISPLLFH